MKHFQPFSSRRILQLPIGKANGWKLKRYGIIAKDREFDLSVAQSALESAIERLPTAGRLEDAEGNHGVGFQIVHFAEVAIVSPVFYWIWGSVLANTFQMRAQWRDTNAFETGVKEVVGCVWEMDIICFETKSWKEIMLGEDSSRDSSYGSLIRYMECCIPSAESAY